MKVAQFSVYVGNDNCGQTYQQFMAGLSNLAAYDNYAVFHYYPGPNPPRAYMGQAIAYAQQISPGNPTWITETGLCTSNANNTIQMYNILDIYLDDFNWVLLAPMYMKQFRTLPREIPARRPMASSS